MRASYLLAAVSGLITIVATASSANALAPTQTNMTESHCQDVLVDQCKIDYPGRGRDYDDCTARALKICSQFPTTELRRTVSAATVLSAGVLQSTTPKPAPAPVINQAVNRAVTTAKVR